MSDSDSPRSPGFRESFLAPFRSVPFLLRHPKLFKYLLVPWGVTFLSIGLLLGGLIYYEVDPLGLIWSEPDSSVLSVLHTVLSVLVTLIGSGFIGYLLGQIAAVPAYSTLAAKTRAWISGQQVQSSGDWYEELLMPLIGEITRLLLFFFFQALFLVLILFPVIGPPLYMVVSTITTLFWIAMEFFDYALDTDKNTPSVFEKIQYIFNHLNMTGGFSVAMFFILSIPVVNVFLLPLGVVGAARLHAEHTGTATS